MVLGIRHVFGFLSNDVVFCGQTLHIPGTICIFLRL